MPINRTMTPLDRRLIASALHQIEEAHMPSKSKAQNRLMHAAAEGKVKGVPPSVGKEFVKADEGRKVGKLPAHVKPKTTETKKR